MFSRSHGKPYGFGKEKKEKDRSQDASQLSALTELGLIGPDYKKARSGGGGAWGTDFNRPNYSSSRAARSFTGVTYPEKSRWTPSRVWRRFFFGSVEASPAPYCYVLRGAGSFACAAAAAAAAVAAVRRKADSLVSRQPDHSIATGTLRAPSHRSTSSISSAKSRESNRAAIIRMNSDRSRSRRERTFVGSECAVCEEPLEHTLRGERILQFSCTHVSHEACFYEFIREIDSQYCPTCNAPLHLDTSRGGNVLDIGKELAYSPSWLGNGADGDASEKISNMVRAVSVTDARSQGTPTPTQWDDQTGRPPSRGSNARPGQGPLSASGVVPRGSLRDSRETRDTRDTRDSRDAPLSDHRYTPGSVSRHGRSDSEATGMTGMASSNGYPETTQSGPPRRHDYDVQAMETSLASPRTVTRNPIPAPTVTVRSEFPTISRSRQQQTLTCLVTIEVPDNKWRPDPEDLQTAPPMRSGGADEGFARPSSPARSAPRFYPYESSEVLADMTESLRSRVDNWHGLDFSRYVSACRAQDPGTRLHSISEEFSGC
jgi:hypothetical protein